MLVIGWRVTNDFNRFRQSESIGKVAFSREVIATEEWGSGSFDRVLAPV